MHHVLLRASIITDLAALVRACTSVRCSLPCSPIDRHRDEKMVTTRQTSRAQHLIIAALKHGLKAPTGPHRSFMMYRLAF